MDALQKITESCMKNELPSFEVGDTVRVQVKIKEGDKERLQAFEGTVIGIKKGGINSTFTVRRISHGCGVERVFPMHSPNVAEVTVTRKGRVRRSKLYYLRDRVGKAAKVKEQIRSVRAKRDRFCPFLFFLPKAEFAARKINGGYRMDRENIAPIPQAGMTEENTKKKKVKEVLEYAESLTVVFAVMLLIFTFIARPATVDGESMLPTLCNGERRVVSNQFY